MIAPELLFRMHPEDALRAMIGEKLRAPLQAHHLRLSKPRVVSGVKTEVDVTIDKGMAPVELWERTNSFTFTYDRVDMGAFTSTIPKSINTDVPVDVEDIFRGLLSPYKIPVDTNDVIPATFVRVGAVTIDADELSYRWTGSMAATLVQRLIQIDNLLLVKKYALPFDNSFNSSAVKSRLAMHINLANASALRIPITAAMFSVSTIAAVGPVDRAENTRVGLIFNDNPYKGQVEVFYQRRSFEDSFRWPKEVAGPQYGNYQQLAGQLSIQMGCEILASDLLSDDFPPVAVGAEQLISVPFAPSSLAYVGSVLIKYRRTS